jgi:hypothetical protein
VAIESSVREVDTALPIHQTGGTWNLTGLGRKLSRMSPRFLIVKGTLKNRSEWRR